MASRRYPLLNNREWLYREYIDNGRLMRDIAAEVGCTAATVLHAMRCHGIESRPPGRIKHGHTGTGWESGTHRTWQDMLNRCRNPRHRQWSNYGGRGITVCERWRGPDGFGMFLVDMGEKPDGLTIDRIDNDGNYEPGNCRWATYTEQNRNRRPRTLVTHCNHGHPYTGENLYVTPGGKRRCRECTRRRKREYERRQREAAA